MNFVMHPQFIGRPGYVRALRDFIRYARDNGAWICTDEQAARWVLARRLYRICLIWALAPAINKKMRGV